MNKLSLRVLLLIHVSCVERQKETLKYDRYERLGEIPIIEKGTHEKKVIGRIKVKDITCVTADSSR